MRAARCPPSTPASPSGTIHRFTSFARGAARERGTAGAAVPTTGAREAPGTTLAPAIIPRQSPRALRPGGAAAHVQGARKVNLPAFGSE